MTNTTNTSNATQAPTFTSKYGSIRDVLKESASVKEQKLQETDPPLNSAYTLGEIFLHNGRSVQVVELQAEGVYHVKATDAPFDSYWLNTGEAVDITNAE